MSRKELELNEVLMTNQEFADWCKTHPTAYRRRITHETCIGIKCDICGKDIQYGTTYLKVTTGHNAWGGDSYESIESAEICSTECLDKCFAKFKDLFNSGENSKTDYIEIAGCKAKFTDISGGENNDA